MWPKLRSSSLVSKSGAHLGLPGYTDASPDQPPSANHVRSSNHAAAATPVNVNDEYKKALRTKSYIDVWTRIRRRLPRRSSTATTPRSHQPATASPNQQDVDLTASTCTTPMSTVTSTCTSTAPSASSSPFFSSYSNLPEYLLEPCNEVASLLGSVRDPGLHDLFLDYFDSTLQACAICGSLLRSVDLLRRENQTIRRLLGPGAADVTGLASYAELENPLSSLATAQFRRVHDVYESLIRRLLLARDRVLRKARLVRIVKRASAVTLVAASAALAAAFLVVGGHAVAVLAVAGGPALVGPFSAWIRKRRWRGSRASRGRLARLGLQLDAAARGAYIMSRDLETMSRLVARLHDEVEHGKEVVRLFLRCGEGWVLRELAQRCSGGGGGDGDGFSEQLDELEEHVYWCLLTINRIRRLVARELTLDVEHASSPPAPGSSSSSSGPSMHAR